MDIFSKIKNIFKSIFKKEEKLYLEESKKIQEKPKFKNDLRVKTSKQIYNEMQEKMQEYIKNGENLSHKELQELKDSINLSIDEMCKEVDRVYEKTEKSIADLKKKKIS